MEFKGTVTAQATANELVTITVTKPDNTTETLSAYTLADKSYSTMKELDAGNYRAKAHGNADAKYEAWDSSEVTFTVPLMVRSGTLTVSIAP